MNIKFFFALVLSIFLLILHSCNDDNTVTYTSPSKDAQIYSFSFTAEAPISADSVIRAQDSIRFIAVNKTKYAIDQVAGLIYNPDSFPYGTVLHKVLPKLGFNPTYGVSQVQIFTPDSINGYIWNTTDSVDFSRQPIEFVVTSIGGDNKKTYKLDLRTHKIDPDTIVWTRMTDIPAKGNSKTLLKNGEFFYYVAANGAVSLYKSNKTSLAWTNQSLSGLPSDVEIQSIILLNGAFYAIDSNGKSYRSADGKAWVTQNNGETLKSILGLLPLNANSDDARLLVVLMKDSKYYLGKSTDLSSVDIVTSISIDPIDNQLPAGFPLSGATSYSSFSSDRLTQMLVLSGGVDVNGKGLSSTWLVKNSEKGIEASAFANNPFVKGVGASLFRYNSGLYLLSENKFYTSALWGESWIKAPLKEALIPAISERTNQTVIVDELNYIWIFGGVSKNNTYPVDVWRGRLNKLNP